MKSAKRKVLVTAALPYSNGRLHVGHITGAYLPSDIYVRYLRSTGADVRYVSGSDDYGVAIMISAGKEGKTPAELSKFYNKKQAEDFAGMNISFDVYGATSQNRFHTKASQDFFKAIYDKGHFEKQRTRQFFDEQRQMFLADRFVTGTCGYCDTPNQNGDQCENCGKILDVDTLKDAQSIISKAPATVRETVHWFIDLSRFEKDVTAWLEKATVREHTRNYVRGLLSTGLIKRAMTRDIDWGIPVPLDDPDAKGKVLYVWFDAPIGYVSNTMQLCADTPGGKAEDYADWWKSPDTEIYHFIGEDNTIFHCVIWIAMLTVEGSFSLPKGVIVNQYLNMQPKGEEVQKISKSRGIGVWIGEYLEKGGDPDILRYYLTVVAPERARTVYRPEDLVQRNNADLANVLGNFVHRVLSFNLKHVGPFVPDFPADKVTDVDRAFAGDLAATFRSATALLEEFSFKATLELLMDFCRRCNKYVDDKMPWATRKTDMPATCVTLAYAIHAIHFLSITLDPFMPSAAKKIRDTLNIDDSGHKWHEAPNALPGGHPLREPQILFTKME